ncbi:PSMC3 interacting protein [Pitangus sulphuratus]|nr:PSMC3 interacting protein [Pitangus sulphuratus]
MALPGTIVHRPLGLMHNQGNRMGPFRPGVWDSAVVKALEQLAQQGRIREKAYGKQKIYFADQEQLPAASDAELRGLDGEIAARSAQLQALQQSCRHMEAGECARAAPRAQRQAQILAQQPSGGPPGHGAVVPQCQLAARAVSGAASPELKDLNGSMTTPEMVKEIEALRKDCASYTEKLERIKSATNHVTPEEKEKVCQEQQLYRREWRRRKRMATELLDAILEGYPKSKKQFFEEVGIETDEEHGVVLPAAL